MPSPVLAELIAGMRAGGIDFAGNPQQARADFEALLATMPADPALTFTATQLGGVPALHADTGAQGAGALLYMHGGAYLGGSASGYRGLAAEIGKVLGLPLWSLDYRLAPEHRFPAAIEDTVAAYRALLDASALGFGL